MASLYRERVSGGTDVFLFLMPLFGRRDLFWINSKTQTRNGHAEFGPLPVISVFFLFFIPVVVFKSLFAPEVEL